LFVSSIEPFRVEEAL
jgi:hypothetical protein